MKRTINQILLCVSILLAGQQAMADVLCFTAGSDNSHVALTKTDDLGNLPSPSLEYSTDGTNWQALPYDTQIALATAGSKMYVRGTNATFSQQRGSSYVHFAMDGEIAASGNVMSLVDSTCTTTAIPGAYCFAGLFEGCQSLVSAPELPATQLTIGCYQGMFADCISLTQAPALPATALTSNCYNAMFQNCTSLTVAPALPAEQLANYCYYSMFSGCSSLTAAPLLPAAQLTNYCYGSMFYGCSSLSRIEVLFEDWATAVNATNLWVNVVAPSGLFICPGTLEPLTNSNNMVPVGWTVRNPVYLDSLQVSLTKTYDNTDSCVIVNPGVVRGFRTGDNADLVVGIAYNDSAAASGKTISVHFGISGPDRGNYIAPEDYVYSTQGVILPKQLMAENISVDTVRVYDATAEATITQPASLTGVLGTDEVVLAQTAAFNDRHAAQNKTVSVSYSISGAQAANYIAPAALTYATQGEITPKPLTASGLDIQTVKDYDYSDSARVIAQPLISGIIAGDDYHVSASALYDSKYIGTGKTITAIYTLSGADLNNYSLAPDTFVYTTAGEIRGKYITIEDLEIDTVRIYDGTDAAFVHSTYKTLGIEEGDDIRIVIAAWFDSKHIGQNKAVFYSVTLSGADAGAYYLQDGDTLIYSQRGEILPRQLYADGAQVTSRKMYDTTPDVYVEAPAVLHNVVDGDQVDMNTLAFFYDAQPQYWKDIVLSYPISGDVADYLAPLNDTLLQEGIIYDSIRVDGIFGASMLCEGSEVMIGATVTRGADELNSGHIYWDDEARAAGLHDQECYRFMPDNYWEEGYEFHFTVPDTILDGTYYGTVRLDGPIDGYYEDYPLMIQVNGSSRLLDDIFADVISIDNHEERFFSYQWQRLNEETWDFEDIQGATLPYYQQEGGLNGCYRVLLNAGTDTELLTCERWFELPEVADAPAHKEMQEGKVVIIRADGKSYSTTGQAIN